MKRCRRCAVFSLLGFCASLLLAFAPVLFACQGRADSDEAGPEPLPSIVEDLPDVAPPPDARHTYYEAYLADVLGGDQRKATENYTKLLGAGAEEPLLVAEAALRLAGWAESNRQRRMAMDLAVRASVLGADMPRIKNAADALRRRLATTVRAQDLEVRGPRAGTVLEGVGATISEQFAAAEVLLSTYHRRRLTPRLEALVASLRGKRAAMERAVRAYRDVADSGVQEAVVAAEFRIASLYYDFSLSLTFELPSELDPEVASSMRSSLRSEVTQLRAKARLAYMRSLAATGKAGPAADPWTEAASIGLASVEDLLRGGK
jgi:hypothetical protein